MVDTVPVCSQSHQTPFANVRNTGKQKFATVVYSWIDQNVKTLKPESELMTCTFEYFDGSPDKKGIGICDIEHVELLNSLWIYLPPPNKQGVRTLVSRSHGSLSVKSIVLSFNGENVWKQLSNGKIVSKGIFLKNGNPVDIRVENLEINNKFD